MSEQTFDKPSEASGGGGIAPFEGCLVILGLKAHGEAPSLSDPSKMKPNVTVTVDVVEAYRQGQMSTQTDIKKPPFQLTAKAGDTADNVRIFAGWLVGAFRNKAPGSRPVLGVLAVERKDGPGGKDQPTWVLNDATPEQVEKAVAYLNNKPKFDSASQEKAAAPASATPAGPAF